MRNHVPLFIIDHLTQTVNKVLARTVARIEQVCCAGIIRGNFSPGDGDERGSAMIAQKSLVPEPGAQDRNSGVPEYGEGS